MTPDTIYYNPSLAQSVYCISDTISKYTRILTSGTMDFNTMVRHGLPFSKRKWAHVHTLRVQTAGSDGRNRDVGI